MCWSLVGKPLSPSPPPLPRPSIAASKAPSRRVRDAAGAPLGQQPPLAAGQLSTSSSRSVTPPPPVNCSPSAVSRVPASLLKVDISAGLPAVSTSRGSCTPPVGASANRRRTTTDDAPRAPSPAVAPVVRRGTPCGCVEEKEPHWLSAVTCQAHGCSWPFVWRVVSTH